MLIPVSTAVSSLPTIRVISSLTIEFTDSPIFSSFLFIELRFWDSTVIIRNELKEKSNSMNIDSNFF
jgi:hypothetical protein